MSRGFSDSFDIDDFRNSDRESDSPWNSRGRDSFPSSRQADRGRGSSSATTRKMELARLQGAEHISDRAFAPENKNLARSQDSPESRDVEPLRDQDRQKYQDCNRSYSLRTSEIHTLTQVGKFRVVSVDDLARFAYGSNRARFDSDLRNLMRQRLVERHGTSAFKKESRQVLALTKQGERLIRRNALVPEDQAIYSGLVKPKEADHDAALYRLCQKVAAEIESKGGKVLRIQLDYELKEQLYRKLGKAQAREKTDRLHLKHALAQQLQLPVVNGKVSFPDVRIEYANQEMEISRVDLELATGHYHASHLAGKASAGFQIYARSEDAAGLRRVRDDREIMTSILSF